MTDKNPDTRPPLQRPDDALTEPSCSGAPGATAIEWKGGGGLTRLLVLKGDDFSSPWLRGHGFIYYTYVATNM